MPTSHFLLLCLIVLPLSLSELCHPNDKKTLLQIKKALNDSSDRFTTWNKDNDCCQWFGPECNPQTNRIMGLRVDNAADISAEIPAAVGDLPHLEYIIFNEVPNLRGPIQPTIAKLTKLKTLWLSNTNITGPIPSFVGDLKHLESIDLSFNRLTGTIPPFFSKLTNITAVSLQGNKLTGTIPESLAKVAFLRLYQNQLTGTIPKSFGDLDLVQILNLSKNKLFGDASLVFGPKKKVFQVDLSENAFKFDLTKIVISKNLLVLDLNHNNIFGSLPESFKLPFWQTFNVSYNQLCGNIPTGGSGQLQGLGPTAYLHNKCLCGAPLPACH